MTWRAAWIGFAGLLILAAAGVAAALFWLTSTESGTRWLVARVEGRAGALLVIERVEGTLTRGLSAESVRVSTAGTEVELRRLTVTLDLSELLTGKIAVPDLTAGEVIVTRGPSDPEPRESPGTAFGFPFELELERARIDSLRVVTPDSELDFGPTAFGGRMQGDEIGVTGLSTATNGVSIEADALLQVATGVFAEARIAWSMERDGTTWSGEGTASGPLADLEFEHRLNAPIRVLARGSARLGRAPRVTATVEWEDFAWPGQELARSPSGRLEIDGWLDGLDVEGSGRVVIEDEEAEATVSAFVTRQAVSLETLSLESRLGRGRISGTVGLERLDWDLEVDAQDLDPGSLVEGWPSAVSAQGRFRGALEPRLQWQADGFTVDGVFRDQPFEASGDLVSNVGETWRLDNVMVDWGGNELFVGGSIEEMLDLSVRIDAPSIGHWSPDLAGHVTAEGELGGTLETPAFVGTAGAESLEIGGVSIDRVELEGNVSGISGAEVDVDFRAEGIADGRPIADVVTGSITGETQSHEIAIDARSPVGTGRLRAVGGFADNRWSGEIGTLSIDQDQLGTWELEQATELSIGNRFLTLERSCLRQSAASLCFGAEVGTGDERIEISLDSFDLSALEFLMDDQVSADGTYDAALSLNGPFDRPTGTFHLVGQSTLISVSEAEAPLDIPINRIEVDATLGERELQFSGMVDATADVGLDFDGTVGGIWTPDAKIDARLDGVWNDVGFLSLLSPDIGRVSGDATLGLTFGGRLDAPEVHGEARWRNGEIAVPRWGLVVEDVQATVTSPDGNTLEYVASAKAGDGTVEATGETELDAEASWPTRFVVTGENLAAVQLPEAQIIVSPELEIQSAWPRVDVSGTVTIPSAELNLDELPNRGITTSNDVVVHGEAAVPAERPLDVRAKLRLVLGDGVRISSSGLNAALAGEIGLDYESGTSAVATGGVSLAGQYMTLGQTLDLDRGQLLFAGPIADPVLDVRAIKRFESSAGEVSVGVLVTGTVSQPVTRLFSDPSMSEGDIISYLVVGRPLSDSSRENSEALQTAALSLGLTQALPQIQHFGESLGLDELGLRTSEANTGELMAGKQISPRVYVRYTYGLMNRVGGLLLRLQLTDHLSLETRAGEYKAMDLLFMRERD